MSSQTVFLISLAVFVGLLAILLAVFFIVRSYRRNRYRNKKPSARNKVQRALKANAVINFYQTINDFSFTYKDRRYHADHVLVGEFGILLVDTLLVRGELYGNEKDNCWVHTTPESKEQVPNYSRRVNETAAALRDRLGQDKSYRNRILTGLVVADDKCELFIHDNLRVMKLADLKKWLTTPEFTKKGNFDTKELYGLLCSYQLN